MRPVAAHDVGAPSTPFLTAFMQPSCFSIILPEITPSAIVFLASASAEPVEGSSSGPLKFITTPS